MVIPVPIYLGVILMKKVIYFLGAYSLLSFATLGVATIVRRVQKCLN